MNKATGWVIVVLVLAALATWYFNARKPAEGHPSVLESVPSSMVNEAPGPSISHPVEAIDAAPEAMPVAVEAEQAQPLPELSESDAAMADVMIGLLGNDAVADWLLTDQVIHRVVATVDSLPSRKVAPLVLPLKPPPGKFQVEGADDVFSLSADNAARYAAYAEMARRVDLSRLAAAYVRFYPLFQQAYEELGYPDGYFNDRLVEVIDHLLETPEPETSPLLVKPEAVYLFADEGLENRSAGQKILLRSGPETRRVLREKLAELREILARQSPR